METPKLRVKWYQKPILPILILIGCVAVAGLHQQGYIDLPHFGSYEMPVEAKIGQQFGYDFSKELIPLLDPQGSNPGIYTFYLGFCNTFRASLLNGAGVGVVHLLLLYIL